MTKVNSSRKTFLTNKIKELRVLHNMTQQELADKIGIRRETIVFLEKGNYNPSLKIAYELSKVFHAQIEQLFIFDKQEPEEISPHRNYIT